jgi:hypothetical protein
MPRNEAGEKEVNKTFCPTESDARLNLSSDGSSEGRCDRCRKRSRRLLERNEVIGMLSVSPENLQQLIATRQLTPIRIAGNERFDSWDVDGLIESYKRTAMRTVVSEQ